MVRLSNADASIKGRVSDVWISMLSFSWCSEDTNKSDFLFGKSMSNIAILPVEMFMIEK